MASFTHESHDGAAQLDSTLQQFREAALQQGRPWQIDVETIDGVLIFNGTVGPKETKEEPAEAKKEA